MAEAGWQDSANVHTRAVYRRLATTASVSREARHVVENTPDTGAEAIRRFVTVLYQYALAAPAGHVVPPSTEDHRRPSDLDLLHAGTGLRADAPDVDLVDWQQVADAFD